MVAPAPPLLEMEGISKGFAGVRALERVDLRCARGEVHAVVGKNGAGKSTLIKILGGVYAPDEGRISLAGTPVELPNPQAAIRQGIAIVHQEGSLVPALSVAENVFLGGWNLSGSEWRVRPAKLRQAAAALLARLTDDIDPHDPVSRLSVAQQQLVEIAKALARKPRILILDEPTSALSNRDADKLLTIVATLARDGVGLIYISHRLAEVERIAQQITVLRDGRTVATANPKELDRAHVVRLMLGEELTEVSGRPPRRARGSVALSVRNLTRRGAFEDVSFDVHAGEILGLAGLVGAGRTELVRAIFGRDRVDGGEIVVGGARVRRPTPSKMARLGVGLTPEDRKAQGFVPTLNIAQNLVLTVFDQLAPHGWLRRKDEFSLAKGVMQDLQVKAPGPQTPVRTLSGGNQQKVVIGKWLARKPRVLLLDEPTRGVDVHAKAQILATLDRLADAGMAIVFISSELEEVLAASHRVLTVARGKIVGEADSQQTSLATILLSATGV